VIAHQRHLLLPLTSPQVLHDNPLLNTALLRILTVGNVLNNSSAMGSAAGCVRDRCSTHHAAADAARWRLQRMMFAGRFEIACLADLAKLQGNAPDSSMLRSGAHAHARTHINTVTFWLSHPIVNVWSPSRFIFESCQQLREWCDQAFGALDASERLSLQVAEQPCLLI
jgi:hypothetical protein